MNNVFDLSGRVAVITGGAGLLGRKHAEAIASQGGISVLVDLEIAEPDEKAIEISKAFGVDAMGCMANITEPQQVSGSADRPGPLQPRGYPHQQRGKQPENGGCGLDRLVAAGELSSRHMAGRSGRRPDRGLSFVVA